MRASTAIADLQVYTQHVIDSMTGGLAATDSDGRIVMFNRAAEAITGVRGAARARAAGGRSAAAARRAARRSLGDVVEPGRGRRVDLPLHAARRPSQLEIGHERSGR